MPARFDELLSHRLAELPAADGGPGGWQAVQARLLRRRTSAARARRIANWSMAASVVVLAVAVVLTVAQRVPSSAQSAADHPAPRATAGASTDVEQLRAQSVALEQVLAALPQRPAVVLAGTALPIDRLEAQVQWLDHQLSVGADTSSAETEQLWRERVEVMSSLVRLRYAEAQQVAM